MTHGDTIQKRYLPNEWALSENEEELLGEKHLNEYYQRVEDYWIDRSAQTCVNTMAAGFCSLFLGAAITIAVCGSTVGSVPQSTNLIIALSIMSTLAITAMTLTALIYRKAEVEGMQNPKDWKKEILGQKTSKTEGSYGTFGHTVENIPAK